MTLRLGIIGCGRVAEERHLPALARATGVGVTALADTDKHRLEQLANRFGVSQRFGDYRALIERADVDVVGVLTPTPSHLEIACAALEAGKHVLVEKPVALDPDQCARLVACASSARGLSTVAFNLRYHRLVREARSVVSSGALGRIKAVRSVYTHNRTGEHAPEWHRVTRLGGGIVANEAVHHFDLWRFLLGAEIEEVCCSSRPSFAYEDETATVMATLSNGILGTGVFTLGSSPTSEVDIYGDGGRLHLSCYRFDGLAFYGWDTYPGDLGDRAVKGVASLRSFAASLAIMRRGGDFQDAFRVLWQRFVDDIREGRAPEATLVDGTRAVEVSAACLASAAAGRPVRVTHAG